jgi:hypothetical protein
MVIIAHGLILGGIEGGKPSDIESTAGLAPRGC